MRTVLFDLGGTLIRTAEVPEIFRKALEAHEIRFSLEEISLTHKESEKQLRPEDYLMPSDEFWTRRNLQILERLGIHENLQSLARVIAEEWWDYADLELYPDVEETLKQLKKTGLKMGLVTNGLQSDIDQILPKVGLANFFDVTVCADAVGKTKPNREIFLYALKKLRVSPQETLFVGDQLETDYEGARKAGLKALLIDREDKIRKRIKKIKSLKEITAHLER